MPIVSVIIPTYNSANLVVDAIDSVLAQTYKDYEIIVVDDGSTDNTRKVLQSYGNQIKYLYQENAHISVARNHGFRVSTGKYIAQLDADDLWLPDKLEKQMKVAEQHPDAGLIYCDSYICDYGKEQQKDRVFFQLYVPPAEGNVFKYFFKTNPLCTSSAVISRNMWERLGGLDTTLRGGQDVEFFLRITYFSAAYFCHEPLMIYRCHSQNTSSTITYANVRSALRKSIKQREVFIRNLKSENAELPLYVIIFDKSPELVQFFMLLWWRLKYGKSLKHTMKLINKYGCKLVGSWFGKKS